MTIYQNGQAVIEGCVICNEPFDEPQKFGKEISCDTEKGGCGNKYRLTMLNQKSNIKEESN